MRGDSLKAIRHSLGLTALQFGKALGYGRGSDETARVSVSQFESDKRPIPPWIARLAYMYWKDKGVPDDIEEQTK